MEPRRSLAGDTNLQVVGIEIESHVYVFITFLLNACCFPAEMPPDLTTQEG